MPQVLPLAFLILTAACSTQVHDTARPTKAHIDSLEAVLGRHPCVGDLSGWERNYRFARKRGLFSEYSLNPDLDVIEFHLRRVGTVTIEGGRNVVAPRPNGDWPDSSAISSLDGKFTLTGSSLQPQACHPAKDQ